MQRLHVLPPHVWIRSQLRSETNALENSVFDPTSCAVFEVVPSVLSDGLAVADVLFRVACLSLPCALDCLISLVED